MFLRLGDRWARVVYKLVPFFDLCCVAIVVTWTGQGMSLVRLRRFRGVQWRTSGWAESSEQWVPSSGDSQINPGPKTRLKFQRWPTLIDPPARHLIGYPRYLCLPGPGLPLNCEYHLRHTRVRVPQQRSRSFISRYPTSRQPPLLALAQQRTFAILPTVWSFEFLPLLDFYDPAVTVDRLT